ncbi:hypothetical protein Tco_1477631 [Tanacetum coccineum]
MVDTGQEEETFDPLEIGMDLFSYESPASLEFEQRTRSYGTPNLQDEIAEPISFLPDRRGLVKRWHGALRMWICFRDHERRTVKGSYMGFADFLQEEYVRDISDPYSRRFDEYNRVFKNETEHLSNEYILRIGKKGIQKLRGNSRDRLDSYSFGNLAEFAAVTA